MNIRYHSKLPLSSSTDDCARYYSNGVQLAEMSGTKRNSFIQSLQTETAAAGEVWVTQQFHEYGVSVNIPGPILLRESAMKCQREILEEETGLLLYLKSATHFEFIFEVLLTIVFLIYYTLYAREVEVGNRSL